MKLIDQTIDILADCNEPLQNAFIKAQIIARRIGSPELGNWVRCESRGYGADDILPDYRKVRITLRGTVENDFQRASDVQLSSYRVPEKYRGLVTRREFRQSINVIERLAEDEDRFVAVVQRELYPFLGHGYINGAVVVHAYGQIPKGYFLQLLTEVRSRLLDLLLGLSEYVPDKSSKRSIEVVKNLFNNAVLGDGVSINLTVGDGNTVASSASVVKKGNWEHLSQELTKLKVRAEDIRKLRTAIESDEATGESGLGKNVQSWITKMISQAGTAAWEVPLQVGAGLLIECINAFLGI